jgi:DNA-binding CsgD family transcriptional regulator
MVDIFVGRQAELAYLHNLLDGARSGLPRVVFIEGPPGIGKTALLRRFLRDVDDGHVLWAAGEELEIRLAFGLVKQLFHGDRLPHAALAAAGEDRSTTLTMGADVVDTLGRLQEGSTVTLAIDDAQWADLASLQSLAFALRRLHTERVLTLIATRDTVSQRLPESLHRFLSNGKGVRLRLRGLDAADLRVLAARMGVGPVSSRVVTRLHEHTQGSPLHARALFEELPPESLHDGDAPLPAPRSFAVLVLGRLASCSPETERLVVAAAVLGRRCSLELATQLAAIERPLEALEQAIRSHLLEEQRSAAERLIAFPHPLVQAAVYLDLGPARRSQLHARAADLVGDESALRHRIAAAAGTDATLATEAAARARDQAASGILPAAIDSLAAAARLSPLRTDRERYLLEAVEWMIEDGNVPEAKALERNLVGFIASARQRYVLGRLALASGLHTAAQAHLVDAWRRCNSRTEPALAVKVAGQLACLHLARRDGALAAEWVRRALATDPEAAHTQHMTDLLFLALGIGGRLQEAAALCSAPPRGLDMPLTEPVDGLVGQGMVRLWSGLTAQAQQELTAAVTAYRRCDSSAQFLLLALIGLADAEYRLGAWDHALTHAELAVATAHESEHLWLLAPAHAVMTFPLAARGEWQRAGTHARAAAKAADLAEDTSSIVYAATAGASLAAARDDPTAVVAVIQPVLRLEPRDGVDDPVILPWQVPYAGALIQLGHLDQADKLVGDLEAAAGERSEPALVADAGRLRGCLEAARGRPGPAAAAFQATLEQTRSAGAQFARALLELAYGRHLRRVGRRTAAIAQLQAARRRMLQLDARPHLDRCQRELEACGTGKATKGTTGAGGLTPQEQAVASLVAAGYSNREAAKELVLSVKTIEFHLGNVFAKLGVRSRSQLVIELPKTRERS